MTEPGRPLAIALDTKGPEIRTGLMVDGVDVIIIPPSTLYPKLTQQPTVLFSLSVDRSNSVDQNQSRSPYEDDQIHDVPRLYNLPTIISLDNQSTHTHPFSSHDVLEKDPNGAFIEVEAVNDGVLSSKKGVNLPGTDVDLPAYPER
ncbi:hypothetical protein PSHT_16508 [Puccinia striiformis]|uniref:Pyruvate kinase barrel domain-containing protein n=1 Tax=Puccinia striiformis TaxID=27350 RepID=A0A2S4U9J6_9BASI|nr:hypothetical protein PSHT_16508 [Puccinia striiformis]